MRVILVLLVLLAGCTAPEESPTPTTAPAAGSAAPTAALRDPPPASSTPPATAGFPWAAGDWWTWEVSSVGHETFRVTTVATGIQGDRVRVDFASLDEGLRALFFHVPPAGLVGPHDLSWPMHGLPTRLLDLPLEDGKTWTGELEGTPVAFGARASSWQGKDAFEILGTYDNDETAIELTYVPGEAVATRIRLLYGSSVPWGEARLVDKGHGHEGTTVRLEATDALLAGAGKPGAPRPMDAFEVPPEATHVLVGCQLSGGPGAFRVQVVPPSGAPFACERHATAPGEPRAMQVLVAPAQAGEWRALLQPLGPGFVFLEAAWVVAS